VSKGIKIFWLEKVCSRGIEKVRVKGDNNRDKYINLGYKVVKMKVV